MPLKGIKKLLFGPAPRIPREEAMKVFKRDHFKCQYCGLDGLHHFNNWLILTIDHIHPHARGGARSMENLVTACQPCNIIKGRRTYASLADAKKYVLAKREKWREVFLAQVKAAGGSGALH